MEALPSLGIASVPSANRLPQKLSPSHREAPLAVHPAHQTTTQAAGTAAILADTPRNYPHEPAHSGRPTN